MNCRNCGNQLPDGAKFCNRCGAQQDLQPTNPPQRPYQQPAQQPYQQNYQPPVQPQQTYQQPQQPYQQPAQSYQQPVQPQQGPRNRLINSLYSRPSRRARSHRKMKKPSAPI